MKKKCTLLILIVMSIGFSGIAQTIKGKISSENDNAPLTGVSVVLKGTNLGTSTDANGNYSLAAPGNSVLIVSFIGYQSQEIPVNQRSIINVSMQEGASSLNEVVVTALGISKAEKSIGYATTTIKSNELVKVASPNFASALYGKAPGVRIAATPGGATSAVNIQIRGINSITGRSQPLIIMDGVPVRDGEVSNNNYWGDQRLRGNGLLDINPEDVESISILKGASAAALYGSEAVNGVVLVTTKKGKVGKKGFAVDFNTSYTVDKIAYTPRYQNVRGAGAPLNVNNSGQDEEGFIYYDTDGDGKKETRGILNFSINYGPKFDGKPTMSWDGQIRPYEAQKNAYQTLFQNAQSSNVNVAVSQATENSSIRFSLTRQDNGSLSINSKNNKNIANLNTSFKFSKRLTTDATVNFVNQNTFNRPYSIDRMINNFTGMIGRFDNGDWYRNKYKTSKGYRFVTGANSQSLTPSENIIRNGFKGDIADYIWRVYENKSTETSNRVIGSLTNNFQILPELKLRARVSTDFTSMKTENRNSTERPLAFGYSGGFSVNNDLFSIIYGDLLLTYNKKISPNLDLSVMGGYTANKETYSGISRGTDGGLSTENLFDNAASVNTPWSGSRRTERVIDAALGTFNLGYKDYLFLEGTIRRDRTSTMNPSNNSFVYPSLNSGFVISEAFKLPDFVSFSKLRASWGIVGNYPDLYLANIAYNQNTLGAQQTGGQPVLYTTIPGTFGNDGIKPEQKHEYEIGFTTKFLDYRFGFDVTYYNAQIRDQILPLTIPNSSGASSVLSNVGTLRNKGVEVSLNAMPVKTQNFKWDMTFNYAWNRNKVEKLANNATELLHADYDGNAAQLRSVVGQPMGDFYAHPVEQLANGTKVVQPDGLYKVDPAKWIKVGNTQPKAVGGFLNTMTYKNIVLDLALDYRIGGSVMPTGINWMKSRGLLEETTQFMDKESGGLSYYVKNGKGIQTTADKGPDGEKVYHDGMLMDGATAEGNKNTNVISQAYYFWNTYNWGGPQYSASRYELYIQDNTYVKMREISLGYILPNRIANKLGASRIQLSAFGRNLFFLFRNIKDMDPEQLTAGSRWSQTVSNAGTNPATRSAGIMLRTTF